MSNGLLLHTYDKQLQDLQVLVETHAHRAEEIAVTTVANSRLLALSRQQIEMMQTLAYDNKATMDNLDQVLTVLERGGTVDEELAQKLKPIATFTIDTNLLLPDSLASSGVVHSTDMLLSELLSESELADVRKHLQRPLFERLRWTKGDYIVVAASVLVGLAIDIFNIAWRVNSPIDKDGVLRQWFSDRLHKHPSDSPIDYQGPGFGGELHRVRSRGHDLSQFFEAMRQTMEGEFHGTRWSYGKPIDVISSVNQHGKPYPQMDWFAAFLNVVVHLFGDFFSSHSLPLPLSSVVYENCGREMRIFVHELYENGYNLRHLTLNTVEVMLAYLAIEVWLWLQYGNDERKEPTVKLKKYEMRSAATGFLSGANIGGCLLFENPFLLNIPVLIVAVDSAARMLSVQTKRHSWILKESRNIDELFIAWDRLRSEMLGDKAR